MKEEDLEQLCIEWIVFEGEYEGYLKRKKEFEDERHRISASRGGGKVSDADVHWGLWNKGLLESAALWNWGEYAQIKQRMANQLKKEGKLNYALNMYLEAFYWEINGPVNKQGYLDLESDPAFKPKELGIPIPALTRNIHRLAGKLNIEDQELQKLFIKQAATIHSNYKLPLLPEDAWLCVIEAINEMQELMARLKKKKA
ncbi:hypothetical protein [Piscirickettsia litoralis]|uniref:hypothetical protein n=1 Tax=Piscirickettsia litoralis TaxID=1891921 RepID=UPI001112CA86|nr:hypothetical protein [Piscirickettsia litoralis]